jgi:hypothetical protein
MPDEAPPAKPEPTPPLKRERSSPASDPAAIFIAAATLFAIFINSQNVGPILMLGVIALLLELRLRPRD